jgi:hypothetical protein
MKQLYEHSIVSRRIRADLKSKSNLNTILYHLLLPFLPVLNPSFIYLDGRIDLETLGQMPTIEDLSEGED